MKVFSLRLTIVLFLLTLLFSFGQERTYGKDITSPGLQSTSHPSFIPTALHSISDIMPWFEKTATPDMSEQSVINNYDGEIVPVIFYGKELFLVTRGLGNVSPKERVNLILNRLNKVLEYKDFNSRDIIVQAKNNDFSIVYKGMVITTINESDIKAFGLTGRELADNYTSIIRATLDDYKRERSMKNILIGIIILIITTIILIIILRALDNIVISIYKKINAWDGTRIKDIKIQNLTLLKGSSIIEVSTLSVSSVYFLAKLIIFYIYLSFSFSLFLWTKDFGRKLLLYVISAISLLWYGMLSYIPELFFILSVIIVTYYILKFVRFIFLELDKGTISFPGFYQEWALPTYSISKFLLVSLAIVIIFPSLPGYDSPAFKGISIFLGILFSLGSTSVVANIVAGVVLIYMNAFKVGDRVKIGDVTGDIIEKTLFVTRIRTIKNVDITMSNSMILGTFINNYSACSQEQGLIIHTTVTIGYDAPWRDVHRLLIDAALSTEYILQDPPPFVFQTSLDDFYVSYEINAYTREANKMACIYSELHRNIQDKFNEGGVEIMSPHYKSLRDGNRTTIPEKYLPKDYNPPEFNISHRGEVLKDK